MAVSAFTPLFNITPTESIAISNSSSISQFKTLLSKSKPKSSTISKASLNPVTSFYDPFVLQIAETLEDSLPISPSTLQKLREASSNSLLSTHWPTRKDEPYRFTDTSFIKQSTILPVSSPLQSSITVFEDTHLPNMSIVDGFLVDSNLSGLPDGVYVGNVSNLDSDEIAHKVFDKISVTHRDLFWSLNGVGAPDLVLVYVPAGCCIESPLHLRYLSMEVGDKESNKLPISNPRVLVMVEKGGEISVIEEFVGGVGDSCYWANSVMEVVIGEGAKVSHSYIQNQSMSAIHIKWTSVQQESTSTYQLIEVSTGGKLSRHNVHIKQDGPDTVTELSTFHLSGCDQTQDLHSKLVLDHPRGFSRQLHKCIVSHSSGQAVFDGNVQVHRKAQQTDAGQLTRSLLLERSATINVKPNLQIEADDVKCSHGAAISDLEQDQLFYFQARGIDLQSARKALVFSFGAEVIERFPNAFIQKKVEADIKRLLDPTLVISKSDYEDFLRDLARQLTQHLASRVDTYMASIIQAFDASWPVVQANAIYLCGSMLSLSDDQHISAIYFSQVFVMLVNKTSRSSDAIVRATCSSALGLLLKSTNSISWRADRLVDRTDSVRSIFSEK